jgi:hypothetical protein
MERRKDRFIALYIDAAIHVRQSHGLTAALQALVAEGVSLETALRALTDPMHRRGRLVSLSDDEQRH